MIPSLSTQLTQTKLTQLHIKITNFIGKIHPVLTCFIIQKPHYLVALPTYNHFFTLKLYLPEPTPKTVYVAVLSNI